MHEVRDKIYSSVPLQFPDYYREQNSLLVTFIEKYQQWFDDRNDRNFSKIGDVDHTYYKFLNSFRQKYLNQFPINRDLDVRFIIKHINDLYRTKGSEEGLKILFRLFFNEEIEVFYPSTSVLRLSDSIWQSDRYLEMKLVKDYENYFIQEGDTLIGDVSGASAVVNQIIFVKFQGAYTPIAYISGLDGEFTPQDSVEVVRFGQAPIFPGRIISGSVVSAQVLPNLREPNQNVGDRIELISQLNGIGAKGFVTNVESIKTGRILLDLNDSGYGYVKSRSVVGEPDADVTGLLINTKYQSDQIVVIRQSDDSDNGSTAQFGYGIRAQNVPILPVNDLIPGPGAPIISFEQGDVDTTNNTITQIDHGFQSGVAVRYYNNGGDSVGGLEDGELYYLIRQDSQTLQISDTLEDALSDPVVPINLSSIGSDVSHTFQTLIAYSQNENGEYATNFVGRGTVIEVDGNRSILYLQSESNFDQQVETENFAFPVVPDNGFVKLQITEPSSDGTEETVIDTIETENISLRNTSASFEFEVADAETIYTILDRIGDYVDVRLDSPNYGMTGSGFERLDTPIVDAFRIYELEIGKIQDPLFVTSNGTDYVNDVEAYIEQKEIINLGKRDIIVTFETTGFPIEVGEIMTQEIQIPNYFTGVLEPYTTQARFLRRVGNQFYFRQTRFHDFDKRLPVNIKQNQVEIRNITRDSTSFPMGLNADIDGPVEFDSGQISEIRIDDSGYRYKDGEVVNIYRQDDDTKIVSTAEVNLSGVGKGVGQWKTKTSFLNESTVAVHDNDYYQEYSFDVSASVPPRLYEQLVEDTVQVTGTKLFSTPLINTENQLVSSLDVEIEVYGFVDKDLMTQELTGENTNKQFVTDDDDYYISTIVQLQFEITA